MVTISIKHLPILVHRCHFIWKDRTVPILELSGLQQTSFKRRTNTNTPNASHDQFIPAEKEIYLPKGFGATKLVFKGRGARGKEEMLAFWRPQGLHPGLERGRPGTSERRNGEVAPQTGRWGRASDGRNGVPRLAQFPALSEPPPFTPSPHPSSKELPGHTRGLRRQVCAQCSEPGGRRPTPALLPELPPGPRCKEPYPKSRSATGGAAGKEAEDLPFYQAMISSRPARPSPCRRFSEPVPAQDRTSRSSQSPATPAVKQRRERVGSEGRRVARRPGRDQRRRLTGSRANTEAGSRPWGAGLHLRASQPARSIPALPGSFKLLFPGPTRVRMDAIPRNVRGAT